MPPVNTDLYASWYSAGSVPERLGTLLHIIYRLLITGLLRLLVGVGRARRAVGRTRVRPQTVPAAGRAGDSGAQSAVVGGVPAGAYVHVIAQHRDLGGAQSQSE